MDPVFPPLDDIRRLQRRKVLQPETCPLRFRVAELPRLDALRKIFIIDDPLLGVFVHDRIFDADSINGRIPEI